jgi:hypothetical protein
MIAVPFGVVVLAYLLVRWDVLIHLSENRRQNNQTKNMQSDVGKTSDANPVPNEALERLRRRHDLRPLTKLEEAIKVQDLPKGIYGFSTCEVATLRANRDNQSPLEIHKKHDGIVYYVGYASNEDLDKYLARPQHFHILLFPHERERTSSLLEIPVAFVSKCEVRAFRDSYLFDLFVRDIPELPD